jgi:hypothetical protein
MLLRTQNLPSALLKRRLWRSRWSDISRCRCVMQNHFQHLGNWKKWPSRCRLSDVICGRMALRTHNLPSERIKKRLWLSRWTDDSRCPNAIRKHFLHTGHRKKRRGRCPLSDVLSRRMVLGTHNLPSKRFKKRHWWSEWSDVFTCRIAMRIHFQYIGYRNKRFGRRRLSDVLRNEWPWEIIICLLDVLKNDFGEVDEAMFQGVERPCVLIFCVLGIE